MDQLSTSEHTVRYYAMLLDITPEELKNAIAETGLSGEEIVEKYFEHVF